MNVTQPGTSILDLIVTPMVNVALKTFVQLNNLHIPLTPFTFYIFRKVEVSNESIVLFFSTFF